MTLQIIIYPELFGGGQQTTYFMALAEMESGFILNPLGGGVPDDPKIWPRPVPGRSKMALSGVPVGNQRVLPGVTPWGGGGGPEDPAGGVSFKKKGLDESHAWPQLNSCYRQHFDTLNPSMTYPAPLCRSTTDIQYDTGPGVRRGRGHPCT